MENFTAHRLRFAAEVQSTIELNEHQGSAIRGSLFHALRNRFCMNREARECAACPLVASCPVATLVSTLKPQSGRGRDVPRPYTVQPPIASESARERGSEGASRRVSEGASQRVGEAMGLPVELPGGRIVFRYAPGERFEFGLTLYAQALQLFPYVVLAVKELEQGGIGRKTEQAKGRWRRGTFSVQEVWAENPLTGEQQPVLKTGDQLVQVPDVPITHQQVCEWANQRGSEWASQRVSESANRRMGESANRRMGEAAKHEPRVTLHFLTPTRIIQRGHLLKPDHFSFQPFFQRLMERLEALSRDFSDTPLRFDDPQGLIEAAGRVKVTDNRLVWEELRSYSTRRRAESPTSGLVGSVVLQTDDWSPFWPWLVWGQFVHVGKDAVKGNGWYRISEAASERVSEEARKRVSESASRRKGG